MRVDTNDVFDITMGSPDSVQITDLGGSFFTCPGLERFSVYYRFFF